MRGALTRREREIYDFVVAFVKQQRRSPSASEIAGALGSKLSTISEHLQHLEQKGFIVYGRFREHGFLIRPLDVEEDPDAYVYVQGTMAADGGVTPVEQPVPLTFRIDAVQEDLFFLMAAEPIPELAIQEGDLLLFESRRPLSPGDLVVWALTDAASETFQVARYEGLGARADVVAARAWVAGERRRGPDPRDLLDRDLHRVAELREAVASWGDGAYWLEPIVPPAEIAARLTRFRAVAESAPQRLGVAGVQIGLYRVLSHWQRNGAEALR